MNCFKVPLSAADLHPLSPLRTTLYIYCNILFQHKASCSLLAVANAVNCGGVKKELFGCVWSHAQYCKVTTNCHWNVRKRGSNYNDRVAAITEIIMAFEMQLCTWLSRTIWNCVIQFFQDSISMRLKQCCRNGVKNHSYISLFWLLNYRSRYIDSTIYYSCLFLRQPLQCTNLLCDLVVRNPLKI